MGIYRYARSRFNAQNKSLACAAMDSFVDDLRNALRRWLVVVRAGNRSDYFRRNTTARGNWLGYFGGRGGHADFHVGEASEPPEAAVSARTALLGHNFTAGPVLISFRTFHHGVCHRNDGRIVLSAISAMPAGLRREYRDQPRGAGDAFR